MTTGEKIRFRRRQLGISIRDLAKTIGVSHGALTKWELNQTKGISDHHFAALAKALDCNILWLLDLDDAITLTPDNVAGLVEVPAAREIPIIGEIACGDPILAVENRDGEASVPADSSADFALRCSGDSMINARIFPGDLVLIRQQSDVDNGEIAAVLLDGEATLKRVYKYSDRVELRPENPLYPVRQVEGPDLVNFRILGKAVSFISEVR